MKKLYSILITIKVNSSEEWQRNIPKEILNFEKKLLCN